MPRTKKRGVASVATQKKTDSLSTTAPLSDAEQAFVAEYARHALAQGPRHPPAFVNEENPRGGPPILTFDPEQHPALFRARLAAATGSSLHAAQVELLTALARVCESKEGSAHTLTAALAHMLDLAPRDGVEGMLAAQMVSVHRIAMELLAEGRRYGQSIELATFRLNQAGRLLRLFAMQLETLNRNRGKGPSEQKVTVQHVHVNDGGQAVVGNVNQAQRAAATGAAEVAPTQTGGGDEE